MLFYRSILTLGGARNGPKLPHAEFDRGGTQNGPKLPHTPFAFSHIRNDTSNKSYRISLIWSRNSYKP